MPRLSFDCEELLNWWEPITDTSFIFNFNWRSLQQLREAITIFLCSRLHNVSKRAMLAISETGCPRLKNMLASNPSTPADMLDFLCAVSPIATLVRIAENPNTGKETLSRLCYHENAEVRAAVADNDKTPESCFKRLANDESIDVRYRAAENPYAPTVVLHSLLKDENPYVSQRARKTLSRLLTDTIAISSQLLAFETQLNPNLADMNTRPNRSLENEIGEPTDVFPIEFKVPKSPV